VWAASAIRNLASQQVFRKLGVKYLGDNQEGYRINYELIPTKELSIEVLEWQVKS
jgi:RimJ/RimL family protein N-acetyltransferase